MFGVSVKMFGVMFGVSVKMFGVSVKIPDAWWHLPGSLYADPMVLTAANLATPDLSHAGILG
jgi:hypothetical protein